MNNLKQTIFILVMICVLPLCVRAQVVVTEIMYDPVGSDTGHEWIELYNVGTSSIKLSEWRLFEGGTNHKIKSTVVDEVLLPQTYSVITDKVSQFRIDYPNYTGQLFTSSFSLGNDSDSLIVRDAKLKDIDTVSYTSVLGAAGDGNSLSRLPDSTAVFSPHTPSPGFAMSTEVITPKVVVVPVSATKKTSKIKHHKATEAGTVAPDTSVIPENDTPDTAVAAAAVPSKNNSSSWVFGVVAVAGLVAASVVASRHAKKHEWDIVEESPEDV